MKTVKTKEAFIELRAGGLSFDKIAKKLKVAKQTLIDWSKELDEEIANKKALNLEALYETYHLHKSQRIKDFAEVVKSLRSEILKRDLTEVDTHKLLELYLKYGEQLDKEIIKPEFKTTREIIEAKEDRNLLEGIDYSKLSNGDLKNLIEIQNKLSGEAPEGKLKVG